MPHSPTSVLSLTDFNGRPLPPDLLASTFDALMRENGYVYCCNVPDDFDHVEFCRSLGDFVPQYTGVMVGDVRPEEGMDDVYHSGNTRPLLPHTEGYDFETLPPRYLALWCVAPCSGSGGETTLADAYAWLECFADEELQRMRETVYDWKTTDGVLRMGIELHSRHPMLEDHEGGLICRFSSNNMLRDGDAFAADVVQRGLEFFEKTHVAIEYESNALVVWDNFRMMHARNAFTDRGRHLKRVQVAA